MGCLESKEEKEPEVSNTPRESEPKKVDPRLPFENYRQLYNMKNSWKAVTRGMANVAKETLITFFKKHPEYQAMHKNIKDMDEERMMASTTFENVALDLFNLFDEVMEAAESHVDMGIAALHRSGKGYAKMEGFTSQYFKDLEEPFMEAIKHHLGDRFTEATENNFRLLFGFCAEQMTIGYNQVANGGASDANRI